MPRMSTKPDPAALRAEHAAFAQIMRRHNQRLFRTARAILRDDAEAEDALQEAYLQAYRALPEFRGEAALSTWLVRIVANEALGRLRKRARRAQVLPFGAEAGPNPEDAVMDESNDAQPERAAARAQARRLIETRIDALPESFRAVFVLREVFGFAHAEIGAAIGRSGAAVRQVAHRAREHVQSRRPGFDVDPDQRRAVTQRFLAAAAGGDIDELMTVLAPDVVLITDGGGKAKAALRPIVGAAKAARFLVAVAGRPYMGIEPSDMTIETAQINGGLGTLITAGRAIAVITTVVADGRITSIQLVANPDKLRGISEGRTRPL